MNFIKDTLIEWIIFIFLVAGIVALSQCSSPRTLYPEQALFNQRIAPRQGYKTFVNQFCVEVDKKDSSKCGKMKVIEYDLNLPEVRKKLSDLFFVCNVAGNRYRISKDHAGLVRSGSKKFIFRGKPRQVDYIDMNLEYQKLLDSNTFCAAQNSDLGRMMFF